MTTQAAGTSLVPDLLALPVPARHQLLATFTQGDLTALFAAAKRDLGTPYGVFADDPVGFAEIALGESLWSKQREIMRSVVDRPIVAVPSCHGSGKTRLDALLTAWWVSVYPPGTALVVTTGPGWREVNRKLWPEIRRVAARYQLPGRVDTTQWHMESADGIEERVAYGFAAADDDTGAGGGIHEPHVLIVMDEAGEIARPFGEGMQAAMSGGHVRQLLTGNPSVDDETSWFEAMCGTANRMIRLPAAETPNFTGEVLGRCRRCPSAAPEHTPAEHLVTPKWADDRIKMHGEDSPWVIAKVKAEFPKGGMARTIPWGWIEAAMARREDGQGERIRVVRHDAGEQNARAGAVAGRVLLDIRDAVASQAATGRWTRLGVDPAADGGDELAVAMSVSESPADGRNVRVKVDVIGIGWGVVDKLREEVAAQRIPADIVDVDVRETAKDTEHYARKRDELWWEFRLRLDPDSDAPVILDVDEKTASQLHAPGYGADSKGRILVESKDSLKRKGLPSPDRGEACLLAVYEPVSTVATRWFSAADLRL